MGCATSARSDVFEKGASKSGSLMLNGFFSVPWLMMARRLANRRRQKRWSKDDCRPRKSVDELLEATS
ncbi:MAG: hypothetical protein E5Y12_29220 [Mesorhizobium sp.]|nr:MAG: hypothetical protein E5Y06_24995 [Mesorhizobium sp.]TJU93120.1 MAG: hypothetical protein E5Y12_29220 [Mesorhizobium sp.]TJU97369.1 MAG: hypothetical protein E5Y08_17750 [Mesorhizobium sp.]TJV16505.1 MAG: hypothetical protein E5Y07_16935 [Mesorhizobium sp.]